MAWDSARKQEVEKDKGSDGRGGKGETCSATVKEREKKQQKTVSEHQG